MYKTLGNLWWQSKAVANVWWKVVFLKFSFVVQFLKLRDLNQLRKYWKQTFRLVVWPQLCMLNLQWWNQLLYGNTCFSYNFLLKNWICKAGNKKNILADLPTHLKQNCAFIFSIHWIYWYQELFCMLELSFSSWIKLAAPVY